MSPPHATARATHLPCSAPLSCRLPSYCSTAPEPLGHYLSGYTEIARWYEDGEACDPETGLIPDARTWPKRARRHENEHRAPTMWILRNVAKHFNRSAADRQCGTQMISFLGRMTSQSTHDWRDLRSAMAHVGLRETWNMSTFGNRMCARSILTSMATRRRFPPP